MTVVWLATGWTRRSGSPRRSPAIPYALRYSCRDWTSTKCTPRPSQPPNCSPSPGGEIAIALGCDTRMVNAVHVGRDHDPGQHPVNGRWHRNDAPDGRVDAAAIAQGGH